MSPPPAEPSLRRQVADALRVLMEGLALTLVAVAPWPFGGVHPVSEAVLTTGVAALVVLGAIRTLLGGRDRGGPCPVLLCLAGLLVVGLVQLAPLPASVVGFFSPGTAALRAEFLPAEVETGPAGEPLSAAGPPATLSVAPDATSAACLKLALVVLAFAAVRSHLASPAALGRLSVVAVVNGSLLAVFALAQAFSSPPDRLYWTFPSQGNVFGPFICRNHFPHYLNVCIGLGLGLLLRGRSGPTPGGVLQSPRALALAVALALMGSSVFFSLSRGGCLSLLGVLVAVLVAGGRRDARGGVLLVGGVAVGVLALLAWFGLPRVEARLATLWGQQATEEGRWAEWRKVLPLAGDFPLFGAGYGSYPFMEPLTRRPGDDPDLVYHHAHNEYVEAVVEGGAVRLALSLLAVGLVYRRVGRFLRAAADRPEAWLAIGGAAGFTAVVLHSVVDFGLHMPAVALLTAVVAAHLAGLPVERQSGGGHAAAVPAAVGWAARLLAVAGAVLALFLAGESWRREGAERCWLAARQVRHQGNATARERQREWLEAAVALDPSRVALQVELADAYVPADGRHTRQGPDLKAGGELDGVGSPPDAAARDRLLRGLALYAAARDRCPLQARPQLQLALHRRHLTGGDPAVAYWHRVKRLRPSDADAWYEAGRAEWAAGAGAEAEASWRHSLECSDRHLPAVLAHLGPPREAVPRFDRVLPPRAGVWWKAAEHVGADPARPRLLARVIELLDGGGGPVTAADARLRGRILADLGRPAEAAAAYRQALALAPKEAEWRVEYARALRECGRLADAELEVRAVLREHPGHEGARALRNTVLGEMIGGR